MLEIPLSEPIRGSFATMTTRTTVLVKIITDTGEFGIGEIWNNFPSWGVYEKLSTLKYGMEPLLIGEDPLNINKINEKLLRTLTVLGMQWGATGPIYHSISGINMALWDLKGKHLGLSVSELLGGAIHSEVEIYASGLVSNRLEETVFKHKEMGVKAFKLRVGFDDETDFKNLKTLRNIIDSDDKLMIDANQKWNRKEAISLLSKYKQFNLTWVEEPLRCDDFDGMRMIRDELKIPVAAGENMYGPRHTRLALEKNSIDIIQPDLSKNGGITEAIKMVEVAGSWDVLFAPHFLSGAVCLAASIHFIASIPGGIILEFDSNPNPIRERLFHEAILIKDGKVKVPTKPGLGFEIDIDFIKHYEVTK